MAPPATNVATAFGVILQSFQDHAAELKDGWLDTTTGGPKHNGMAHLTTLFHTDAMPAKSAAVLVCAWFMLVPG